MQLLFLDIKSEIAWVKIQVKENKKINTGALYCPPGSDKTTLNYVDNCVTTLTQSNT